MYLLTSTQYASEQKICELAQGYNKLVKKSDGQEYMISPFAPVNLPLLTEANFSHQIENMVMNPQQSLRLTNYTSNEGFQNDKVSSSKSSESKKNESGLSILGKRENATTEERLVYSDSDQPDMKRQKTDMDTLRKSFVTKSEFNEALL